MDAERYLEMGEKQPYHYLPPLDWAERAAVGVLAELGGRKGVGQMLGDVDGGVRAEIVEQLASIIRAAAPDELKEG